MKSKRIFLFIPFILFVLLILQGWFQQDVLNEYLIPLVFDRIEPSYVLDLAFLFIIVSIPFLYKENFTKQFKPSNLSLLGSFLLILVYFYYRFLNGEYSFIETKVCQNIVYGDLVLVFGSLYPLMFLNHKIGDKESKINYEGGFKEDNPIEDIDSDLLGRKRYAEEIAERIVNTKNENSFALGVVGSWGTGKTSFLELIKSSLNEDELLILDYNPWNITGNNSIASNFFESFSIELEKYSSRLSNVIQAYSSKLTKSSKNFFLTAVAEWFNLLSNRSKDSLYDEINSQLKEIDKQIIIFLDDLDRLDDKEIIEVVKLIRNSANFYRTFFIASYDREYLMNAIKKINQSNYQSFLEKIFQIEITLPRFEEDIIFKELEDSLKRILSEADYQNLLAELNKIDHNSIYRSSFVDFRSINIPKYYLETLRDVTRFINLFSISYSQLKGEVYVRDLFYLEILRLKHPNIHQLIFEKSEEFLETTDTQTTANKKYVLKKNEDQESGTPQKTELEKYLDSNQNVFHVEDEDIEAIILTLKRIFWRSIHTDINSLSVTIPSNFSKYFSYRLLEGDLSEVEFSKARKKKKEEFFEEIDNWIEKGYDSEVERKLANITDFDNKEDFEKVISAIFHFANTESKSDESFMPFKGFNARNLYEKMHDSQERITQKFYDGNSDKYKDFIYCLLNSVDEAYNFDAAFLRFLNTELNIFNFPLSLDERSDFLISCLENHLKNTAEFDLTTWQIFTCTKRWESEDIRRKIYPAKSKKLLKTFIIENAVQSYFEFFITQDRESSKYYLGDGINALFDSFKELKKFAENLEETPVSTELNSFLDKMDGENAIDFEFKYLNL